MQDLNVTDIVRHDKDEAGRHVLIVGTSKVIPVYDCNGQVFVIGRADFAEAIKAAVVIGWNRKTEAISETLKQAAAQVAL